MNHLSCLLVLVASFACTVPLSAEAAPGAAQAESVLGSPVEGSFDDVALPEFLAELAEQSGLSIAIAPAARELEGVTMELHGVPLRQVLEALEITHPQVALTLLGDRFLIVTRRSASNTLLAEPAVERPALPLADPGLAKPRLADPRPAPPAIEEPFDLGDIDVEFPTFEELQLRTALDLLAKGKTDEAQLLARRAVKSSPEVLTKFSEADQKELRTLIGN